MSPEEFEKKLQELFQSAPEGTTMFTTYSNDTHKRPNIYFLQGNPVGITYDLTLFARKEDNAKHIISMSVKAQSYFNN